MGKKDKSEKTADAAENIRVLVRCRPLNSKEQENNYKSCVDLDLAENTVTVNTLCGAPDRWTFDAVINNSYTQRDVFTQFIRPLVDSVLEGFNATVFAYGQSGSGKTHTMTGKMGDPELEGLIPRTFSYVFQMLKQYQASQPGKRYSLYVSFIELYNGKVRDLLAKLQVTLAVKENKDKTFFVQGAHIPQVKTPEDILTHMEEGTERRQVAATELNADSSRSHSIFSLIVECTETSDDGDVRSVTSKLNLVDLAGSERQSKTGASGDTLKEGCNINLSLSALGTVIDTLVKGKGHVPFRSSPLTMLLKDSLGGSSKTVMFANIGPSEHNVSETISTLRFADRAKQIKNKPVVNMDTKDQKIAELTEQVSELKEKLKQFETGGMKQLEEEAESLRERVGELEVDLDNAIKGREADAVDHSNAKSQLQMEKDELLHLTEELKERLSSLQMEFEMQESCAQDERRQREEVYRVCTQYLRAGAGSSGGDGSLPPIADVDTLVKVFQDQAHGSNSAELSRVQSQWHNAVVELKAKQTEFEATVAELQAQLTQAKAENTALSKKLRKSKDTLAEEREARKQLACIAAAGGGGGGNGTGLDATLTSPPKRSNSISVHMAQRDAALEGEAAAAWRHEKQEMEDRHGREVEAMEETIQNLVQQQKQNDHVQELEAKMAAERKSAAEEIAQLKAHLNEAREALKGGSEAEDAAGPPSSSSPAAVRGLKLLVKQLEASNQRHEKQIETLEQHIGELRLAAKEHAHLHHRRQRSTSFVQQDESVSLLNTMSLNHNNKADASLTAVMGGSSPKVLELDLKEALRHQAERDALRDELVSTSRQRNDLLVEMLKSNNTTHPSSASLDTKDREESPQQEGPVIITQLTTENNRLQEKLQEAKQALDAVRTSEYIASVETRKADAVQSENRENEQQESRLLRRKAMALQTQLEELRIQTAEKEQQLLQHIENLQRSVKRLKGQQEKKSSSKVSVPAGASSSGEEKSNKNSKKSKKQQPQSEAPFSAPADDDDGVGGGDSSDECLSPTALAESANDVFGESESPMKSVVDMLQRDKANLVAEVNRLERELLVRTVEQRVTSSSGGPRTPTGSSPQRNPRRLSSGGPAAGEHDAAAAHPPNVLHGVSDHPSLSHAGDGGASGAETTEEQNHHHHNHAANSEVAHLLGAMHEDQAHWAEVEAELRTRTTMLELERSQWVKDLEALRGELEDEREQRQTLEADRRSLQDSVKALRGELATSERQAGSLENLLHEQQAEYQRLLKDTEGHNDRVQDLEGRLSERSAQLNELRSNVDKQRALLAKAQERSEEAHASLKEFMKQQAEKDRQHAEVLREREEAAQRAANRRIEALAEEHQKDLARKDEDIQKVKKKLKKMEAQLQKSKEKYDEKVCEYEELCGMLEEQKVESMKMLLKQGHTAQEVEVYDQQEQIQSTLQRVKDEQRRKKDLFAMGETQSALSQVRAGGNAVNLLKKLSSSGAGGVDDGGSGRGVSNNNNNNSSSSKRSAHTTSSYHGSNGGGPLNDEDYDF